MADYISTLSGVQMDAALMDMAEHNSEAYAVGERNGNPVGADDVTYHNNARYYAQQAQSIAPASVTEAVRWDVAQTALTDAQREQARENIKATPYNYNILDNSWFLVNSRGQSSYASSGYTVDRWLNSTSNLTTTISNGVVTLTNASGGGLAQLFSSGLKASMNGKTVTLSVKMTDDTIISVTGVYSSSSTNISVPLNADYSAYLQENRVIIYTSNTNKTISFKAVKLELGSFSTLAQDTPPDYGEELTRCIYSTADPTDTYANNGFGRSNENLLMNPWWGSNEVVNQRGQSSYTTSGYCIDRWVSNLGVTLGASGLTMSSSANYQSFTQRFENPAKFANGTYTISVNVVGGTTLPWVLVYQDNSTEIARFRLQSGITSYTFTTGSAGIASVAINNLTATSINPTIRAIKLEKGTVSTLANDVAPDYGTELLKCMRYFFRLKSSNSYCPFGTALGASTNAAYIFVPLPVTLRALPTSVSSSAIAQFSLYGESGDYAMSSISARGITPNGVSLAGTATGVTTHGTYSFICKDTTSYIDISADL